MFQSFILTLWRLDFAFEMVALLHSVLRKELNILVLIFLYCYLGYEFIFSHAGSSNHTCTGRSCIFSPRFPRTYYSYDLQECGACYFGTCKDNVSVLWASFILLHLKLFLNVTLSFLVEKLLAYWRNYNTIYLLLFHLV